MEREIDKQVRELVRAELRASRRRWVRAFAIVALMSVPFLVGALPMRTFSTGDTLLASDFQALWDATIENGLLPKSVSAFPSPAHTLINNSGSCLPNGGDAAWKDINNMSVMFTTASDGDIEIELVGTITDPLSAPGTHCVFRYVVDGVVHPRCDDPDWGCGVVSADSYMHWVLGTKQRSTVSAGQHIVKVQGRVGHCGSVAPPAECLWDESRGATLYVTYR